MSFFKEAAQVLGLDWVKISGGYQVINYNGEALYVEGAKKVISILSDEIILDVGKAEIVVSGDNLTIFDITGAAVMIKGKIAAHSLRNVKPENKKQGNNNDKSQQKSEVKKHEKKR